MEQSRPGYSFVSVDMSGAEFRIVVEASGEEMMIEAFRNGWDAHSVGAEIIFGAKWKSAAEPSCAYYNKGADGNDHKKCKCKLHKALRDQIKAISADSAPAL